MTEWEPLADHLGAVARRAGAFAEAFGLGEAAAVAGRLHDIGKCSQEFQSYISTDRGDGGQAKGPDHSTAGARVAVETYGLQLGRMLAFAIAGHHAGLADFSSLDKRLDSEAYPIKGYAGWKAHTGSLPPVSLLSPSSNFLRSPEQGFSQAFLIRMLFSCLVDADFLETERFYAKANVEEVERDKFLNPQILRDRLRDHMNQLRQGAGAAVVNSVRNRVLDHAMQKAEMPPGLFTLTVPTGGGKTLASLSFALEHAVRHDLRRVVYVIPYTSIIEQTAQVFREALKTEDDVLEHHASFDWDRSAGVDGADDEGRDGLVKLRRAAENWAAPIVVTTAVQFFESLFAARTSRCRKLHNLARSVIILDEAQSLPLHLLRPCMAALDELARNYSATVVLCTATQPALREKDGFDRGLKIDDQHELAPEPDRLYAELKRVSVEHRKEPVADAEIAARFAEQPRMLCIVNRRAHAHALYDRIRDLPGATHLSTLMCPRHRRCVLADLRGRLNAGEPVRLVATSLIEAGVDIDFPEVWRAAAGLDSIAQAAGRCNREGGLEGLGRTVVFDPEQADASKPPREVLAFWQAARPVLLEHSDPLSLEAVRAYFKELYWQKGDKAFDAPTVEGRKWPILISLKERSPGLNFEFEKMARAFRFIEDVMEPVIVPWDGDATRLLAKIAASDRPYAGDLRKLQQYTVSIPRRVQAIWLSRGVLAQVHPRLGSGLFRLQDRSHYASETGLDIDDSESRGAESNVIS